MSEDNIVHLKDLSNINDPLTEILRNGARELLKNAIEDELNNMLSEYKDKKCPDGKQQIVRNGYLPERSIQTGIGDVEVKVPRVRDRGKEGIKFNSCLLPRYLKRSASIEEFIPYLYLKGISTGDFSDALKAILGHEASGLSPSTICRMKESWEDEYINWCNRDLKNKEYVYIWADGVYIEAKKDSKQCLLVIIGADVTGKKEVLAIHDGYRESSQSWKELLLDIKARGLNVSPKLAIGDGAMGFWSALREVYPDTKEQRCWVHKTANLLNCFPKSMHEKVKHNIHNIWMAETKNDAQKSAEYFLECYQDKYPKAAHNLEKDIDKLLTFYDFPAKHWISIRSTNVIESVFATVRHRTYKAKGCLSRKTAMIMTFKLILNAQKNWQRLKGGYHCAEIIRGVKFRDGVEDNDNSNYIKIEEKDAA